MRLIIACVGRMKQGPERELVKRYRERASKAGRSLGLRGVEIVEIKESRARDLDRRMVEESIAIANVIPDRATTVLLDETGDQLSSADLAGLLKNWRDAGKQAVVFVIGGADGLAPTLREGADLHLAFGKATWPHQLVRVMVLEQVYRAITILFGHPYHRD